MKRSCREVDDLEEAVWISAAFLAAEISVRPPWNVFIFPIEKYVHRIKVSKKNDRFKYEKSFTGVDNISGVCRKDAKAVQWNARGVASMRSLPGPSKEQLFVEDYLQRRWQSCCWAATIVTDVASLSREHDSYGLLQMPPPGTPGFADVVQLLLQSYALLDRFMLVRLRLRSCVNQCCCFQK